MWVQTTWNCDVKSEFLLKVRFPNTDVRSDVPSCRSKAFLSLCSRTFWQVSSKVNSVLIRMFPIEMVSTSVIPVKIKNRKVWWRLQESFPFKNKCRLLHRTSISLHKGKQNRFPSVTVCIAIDCKLIIKYSSSWPLHRRRHHAAQDKIRYRTQRRNSWNVYVYGWRWRVVTSKNQPIQSKMTAINGERSRIGTITRQLGVGWPSIGALIDRLEPRWTFVNWIIGGAFFGA